MFDNFLGLVQKGYDKERSNRNKYRGSCGHISTYNAAAQKFNYQEDEKNFDRELKIAEASRPIINITLGSNTNDSNCISNLSDKDLDILAEKIVSRVKKSL